MTHFTKYMSIFQMGVVMFMNLPLKQVELPLGNLTLSDKEQPS